MGFAETLIYAADTVEALASNRFVLIAAAVLAVTVAGSFAIGEAGARLRAGLVRLALFALIGAFGALAMVAVKGVPAPQSAEAEAPPKAGKRLEAWIARQQQNADAARERSARTGPSPEARTVEAARLRLLERVEARQALERARAEIRRIPEAERTPEQRRRDAGIEVGLARLDHAEGSIEAAIQRYHAAQAVFVRLADPQSRRAGAEAELHAASALEERNDTEGARAAYRSAIAGRRGLAELPERERRDGIASALLRYAHFEIGRREQRPARAAIDEAAEHYAFLRAQRGAFDVIAARARLAIVVGDGEAARGEIAGLRALLSRPALAALAPEVDIVEARLLVAEGRAPEAMALLARAVVALRKEAEGKPAAKREAQRRLSAALLERAEAGFAAREAAAARAHAAEAVAMRRALAEPLGLVDALARLAVWEAGAGETGAAERALAAALEARRALAEIHPGSEAEGAMRLLCAGALRGRALCRQVPDADATGTGP
jgi:hypothetical protein